MQPFLLYYVNCVVLTLTSTLIIRISAQPRISAHLGQAHILKAEKVNKRPPPPAPNQTQISAHPHPTHLSDNEIEIEIESTNKRLPRGGSFCSEYLQKPRFVTSSRFFYSHLLIVLLQNIKHATLAENGENLISAHLE